MRLMPHTLFGLVLVLAAQTSSAAALQPVRAIVAYKNALPHGIAADLTALGVSDGWELPTINAVAVTAPMAVLTEIAKDPRVKAITRQRRIQFHLYGSVEQINARGVEQAETIAGPAGSTIERPGVTGRGVTVAIIDSGIAATHPAFLGRVLVGRNFEFSLFRREAGVIPAAAWDAYALASGPLALQDEVGHGTHCAGIVGGDGALGSGLDLRGVAPDAGLVSLKIASGFNGVVEDIGFEANAVAAIDHLIRNREALGNVRVASNSWGLLAEEAQAPILGATDFDPVAEVVKAAVDAGIVMVFSGGNDGGGPDENTVRAVPNGMDEVIAVASACKANNGSCAGGRINSFSSRGPEVDISAPGDQILSAMSHASVLAPIGQTLEGDYFGDSPQDQAQNRANYMRLSGTSMAGPHIAGVVALLLQANPELTPTQIREILTATADDLAIEGDAELKPGVDNASGYGMVNVRKALAAAVQPTKAKSQGSGLLTGALGLSWLAGFAVLSFVRRRN